MTVGQLISFPFRCKVLFVLYFIFFNNHRQPSLTSIKHSPTQIDNDNSWKVTFNRLMCEVESKRHKVKLTAL